MFISKFTIIWICDYVMYGLYLGDSNKFSRYQIDYIDLKEFGEALINSGDESVTWCNWGGGCEVVTTGYGW